MVFASHKYIVFEEEPGKAPDTDLDEEVLFLREYVWLTTSLDIAGIIHNIACA